MGRGGRERERGGHGKVRNRVGKCAPRAVPAIHRNVVFGKKGGKAGRGTGRRHMVAWKAHDHANQRAREMEKKIRAEARQK